MNKAKHNLVIVFIVFGFLSSVFAQINNRLCYINPSETSKRIIYGNVWWFDFTVVNNSDYTIENPRIEVQYSSGVRLLHSNRWKGKSGLNPRKYATKDQANRRVYFDIPKIEPHSETEMWVAFVSKKTETHYFSARMLVKSEDGSWVEWSPPQPTTIDTIKSDTVGQLAVPEDTAEIETTAIKSISESDNSIDDSKSENIRDSQYELKFRDTLTGKLGVITILFIFILLMLIWIESIFIYIRLGKIKKALKSDIFTSPFSENEKEKISLEPEIETEKNGQEDMRAISFEEPKEPENTVKSNIEEEETYIASERTNDTQPIIEQEGKSEIGEYNKIDEDDAVNEMTQVKYDGEENEAQNNVDIIGENEGNDNISDNEDEIETDDENKTEKQKETQTDELKELLNKLKKIS